MIQLRQILCPVDFSDVSRHAFDHAVSLARWYRSTLTLLYVHHIIPVAAAAPEVIPTLVLTPETREELLQELKTFAGEDAARGIPVEFEIAEGSPAREILETTTTTFADLLVVGTHGRSGFERLLLGSVAEKVLRKAECPVLTVPPRASNTLPVAPMFKRILCAVDFSDCSLRALEYAISLAQEADASLTVAHVFDLEGVMPADWRDAQTPSSVLRELHAIEGERRDSLAHAVPDNVKTFCQVETVMERGTPYREILRLADERHTELIVMGIHGRNAADLMFFGSTTNHVVRQATCPVLTIRKA